MSMLIVCTWPSCFGLAAVPQWVIIWQSKGTSHVLEHEENVVSPQETMILLVEAPDSLPRDSCWKMNSVIPQFLTLQDSDFYLHDNWKFGWSLDIPYHFSTGGLWSHFPVQWVAELPGFALSLSQGWSVFSSCHSFSISASPVPGEHQDQTNGLAESPELGVSQSLYSSVKPPTLTSL